MTVKYYESKNELSQGRRTLPGRKPARPMKVDIRVQNLGDTKMQNVIITTRPEGLLKNQIIPAILPDGIISETLKLSPGQSVRLKFQEEFFYCPPPMEISFDF